MNDKHKRWKMRDWEIDRFVRAYRKKLFCFKCRWGSAGDSWPNHRPRVDFADGIMAPGKKGESNCHQFLVVSPFTRLFSQEYLIQFSAAWELFGIYKQPRERLEAETDGYAIDLCVYDAPRPPYGTGKPVIGREVKVKRKMHNKLVSDIKRCRGLLKAKKKDCLSGEEYCGDHRKCTWIRNHPTVRYLWVRSQDESDMFKVQRTADGGFDLNGPVPHSQRHKVLARRNW